MLPVPGALPEFVESNRTQEVIAGYFLAQGADVVERSEAFRIVLTDNESRREFVPGGNSFGLQLGGREELLGRGD